MFEINKAVASESTCLWILHHDYLIDFAKAIKDFSNFTLCRAHMQIENSQNSWRFLLPKENEYKIDLCWKFWRGEEKSYHILSSNVCNSYSTCWRMTPASVAISFNRATSFALISWSFACGRRWRWQSVIFQWWWAILCIAINIHNLRLFELSFEDWRQDLSIALVRTCNYCCFDILKLNDFWIFWRKKIEKSCWKNCKKRVNLMVLLTNDCHATFSLCLWL